MVNEKQQPARTSNLGTFPPAQLNRVFSGSTTTSVQWRVVKPPGTGSLSAWSPLKPSSFDGSLSVTRQEHAGRRSHVQCVPVYRRPQLPIVSQYRQYRCSAFSIWLIPVDLLASTISSRCPDIGWVWNCLAWRFRFSFRSGFVKRLPGDGNESSEPAAPDSRLQRGAPDRAGPARLCGLLCQGLPRRVP